MSTDLIPQGTLIGDYIIDSKIGHGSFATVYKAKHKSLDQTVAIKAVLRSQLTAKLQEKLESEIAILRTVRHDNVVRLVACEKTDTYIFLIMEYCSLGDLSQFMKQYKHDHPDVRLGLPEHLVRHFLGQIASALECLRSHDLVHRDLKPQNLLLERVDGVSDPVLKLADFGFARSLPSSSLADTLCGSPLYMGPEILTYKKYDARADLWSVGIILYEMITGVPPFTAHNPMELMQVIHDSHDQIPFPDERDDMNESISSELKHLIRRLLKRNPEDRLDFEQFFLEAAAMLVTPLPDLATSSMIDLSSRSITTVERDDTNDEDDELQDYIILDRRTVETNQFADEVEDVTRLRDVQHRRSLYGSDPIRHQHTSEPVKRTSGLRRLSVGSTGTTLARWALSVASARLFGAHSSRTDKGTESLGSPPPLRLLLASCSSEEKRMFRHISMLAWMAHAVGQYADSTTQDLHKGRHMDTSQTAAALHSKVLGLVERGLGMAKSAYEHDDTGTVPAPLHRTVQWMRDRFNTSLQGVRAAGTQGHADCSDSDPGDVETLLYHRALHMSRAAAVRELMGEDLGQCEQDYEMVIWLLEAILVSSKDHGHPVELDDKRIIIKFIDAIRHRICTLRQKKHQQQHQKQNQTHKVSPAS